MDFAQVGTDFSTLVKEIASGAAQRSLEDIGRALADLTGQGGGTAPEPPAPPRQRIDERQPFGSPDEAPPFGAPPTGG